MKIEKIFLTPHFHFDFEWWKEEPYHEQDTMVIIDEALRILGTYPEFTYVIDTALPLKYYIENRPDGLRKIKKFIQEGRLEIVGGDIVAPDEVLPTGEALIRQYEEGQAWLQETFGIQAQVAWEIDEFAHPARMPEVLVPLGFNYFVFARGVKPFYAMHPTLFYWKDPASQSELLTVWWAAHYECCQPGIINSEKSRKKNIKRFFKEMESRIEFEGSRSPVPWLMLPLGGDFVIPNSVWIDFVYEWNQKKEIKLEFTIPSVYFEKIKSFEIPNYTGLFPQIFDGYFASREKGKQAGRKNANKLCELEKLASVSSLNGFALPGQELQEAWWEVLKGDSHDTIAGTGTDRVYRKNMERYAKAEIIHQKLEEKTFSYLQTVLKHDSHYVFNCLNWERYEVIRQNGKEVLVKAAPLTLSALELIEKPLFPIVVHDNGVESEFLKIEINNHNGAISIFDKEKQVSPLCEGGNQTCIMDDAGNLWVSRSTNKRYPVKFTGFEIEKRSDFTGSIKITEENPFVEIRKEIILYSHNKRIDFKTDILFKGKDKRLYIQFPFSFSGIWITENIFHTTEVTQGIFPIQNFALYKGENYQIALLNKGIPGYLLEKNMGSIILMRSVSMFSWSFIRWVFKNLILITKSLKEASVYLRKHLNIIEFPVYPVHNLFLRDFATEGDIEGHGAMNPISHRNARRKFYKESLAWERGKHSFQYALFMDIKDLAEATLAGFEFNNPLWNKTIAGSGNLESIQFLTKGSNKIVITSLKPYENGFLMRAYEPQGMSARVQLSFGIPFTKIYKVNGKLEKMTELKYENNELWYEFKPYEIVQFQLLRHEQQ